LSSPYVNIIESIGQILCNERFPTQQRTALNRCSSRARSASETAGLRVLVEAGAPVETMSPAETKSWIWLTHCMSLMSATHRNPHSAANEARPGFVLQRIGYSEKRLGRLLDAQGEMFQTLLENAARSMASAGKRVNWSKIAPLILSVQPRSPWAENARIAICRDFLLASINSSSAKGKTMASVDTLTMRQVS
jgi:hypothetical protein